MTAQIVLLNPESAFALARRVICSASYDEETVEAALDVLAYSADDNDRATVRWLREYAPQIAADMAQIEAEDVRPTHDRKLAWLVCSIAVAAGILGGTLMEAAMTAANAGAM